MIFGQGSRKEGWCIDSKTYFLSITSTNAETMVEVDVVENQPRNPTA